MADLATLLAVLEHDPDDAQALRALAEVARQTPPDVRATKLSSSRKVLATRGRPDGIVKLLDVELGATDNVDRRVDLLIEKGMVLDGELLDVKAARGAFDSVLSLRADDSMAKEAIAELDLAEQNWRKFADKFLKEASASTDRSLATGLYVSAAEAYVKFDPASQEAESYLRKALEIDNKNTKAAFHLKRLLEANSRWADLAQLLEQRSELAASAEERISALLALAHVARTHLDDAARADAATKRVLHIDPGQPQALRTVTDQLMAAQNWLALVATYQAALRARRDFEDIGILVQIAMTLWKHVGDMDQAEEYFRRVRKIEPAHPAALDFYRVYYPAKGENQKLLALLRQVEKSPRARSESARGLGVEIAELAEQQNNPEKAIDAWKQILRQEGQSPVAAQGRAALARLYRKTEKWNALLDLMKDEIDRLPETDIAGRVAKLHEVVEIYRDKLRLDVMVINTYNAILKLEPENARANEELAGKFRSLGRWNDLIAVLTRRSESPDVADAERVQLLREIADLWGERFGNFANAVRPLERILEIAPPQSELFADAVQRLKEIYTKRRQWRALIDLLGREARGMPDADRRAKQFEMARLAAERLGDTRLAIEIFNDILAEAGTDHAETLAALAGLYEREKRWMPLAEILHRQAEALLKDPEKKKETIALLEKLGQVYADRLSAPQAGANVWQQVLELDPNHARGLRTLRELYAMAGDFAGLEKLYARLGQEEELVEALLGIADRLEAKQQRLPLVERAAQIAQQRAEAAAAGNAPVPAPAPKGRRGRTNEEGTPAQQALERARQVWERVLAIEPQHVGAATALAPIYTAQEKWARLITMLEIEVAAAPDLAAKLHKIGQIRQLTEQKLASRTLAFTWTLRAFDLDPTSDALYGDVLRLASEPDQWREVVGVFEKHARSTAIETKIRLKLLRELARIASRRLADPERARGYYRQILELDPEARDAELQLEELAVQVADWEGLLASYRKRAARETDQTSKASLLVEIAALQEEKLVDLDGAAQTDRDALELAPTSTRALRAIARIEEARGNWDALVEVLAKELQQTPDGQPRFDLLMRLGVLEEQSLERPANALAHYRAAMSLQIPAAPGGATRPQPVAAIARLILTPTLDPKLIDAKERVAAARLILPHLEAAKNVQLQAIALEVIRAGAETSAAEKLDLDRQMLRLYHTDLGDPGAAWEAGLRVLAVEPTDGDIRGSLAVLAGQLGRDGEWARHLASALATLKSNNGPSVEIRRVATELARLAADRLGDAATAERAWHTVLEVEQDAADAFDELAAMYRAADRWTDLRGLLERRADVGLDERVRMRVLLEIAALEEDVLNEPERAVAAHNRVLQLDGSYLPSYEALDRLYSAREQWQELEELLASEVDHVTSAPHQIHITYRRAELFADELGDRNRAVDLLEDVVARDRSHPEARELLESLVKKPETKLRVAKLLEPVYEQEKAWAKLVEVLRAQRTLATGTEAVELLSRIAAIEEAEVDGAARAFDAWIEVLGLDPTHERARSELSRLAQQLNRWPEATQALEAAANAAPATDTLTRGALLGELATYYDVQLGDAERAINSYKRLLEMDQTNPSNVRRAASALARLYEEQENWPELRAMTRKLSDWAEDGGERRTLLARVAALEEEKLANRNAAISTWREILDSQAQDAAALEALERLYTVTENWSELVDILRHKLDYQLSASADPIASRSLLARIADLHEHRLKEPEEAIAAYLEILDSNAEDRGALAELSRLYRASSRHAELLDVLERQVPLEPDQAIALQIQIAQLLGGPLTRPVEALERWATVLQEEPQHVEALGAVEAGLADPETRILAADILRPVYDATAQHERLAVLQERAADWTDDPAAKLRALGEVTRLREHMLADKAGAFAAQLMMLSYAATEPELGRVIEDTERLAGELEREGDLIDAYREVAPNVLDAEIQRRLYLDIADLARAVRKDMALARDYYQKVLDGQPDDRRALAALESIYRETNDNERLTEILLRQADAATGDVDDRVGALVEAAMLYAEQRRPDDAINTWEQVLAIAPERKDAVDALEALYREQGRWPDVVDLYERRLGFATSIEEAVALRVQLGEIHEKQLRDFETAIDNFSAALSGDQRNQVALAAVERYLVDPDLRVVAAEVLEPIYVAQHRWTDLVRVYEARLESAGDPRERLKLTRFVARLYEDHLEDFDNACKWYAKVFREDPADDTIRDQLQRLASVTDNWKFVADTYQAYLDDESGESDEIREVAIAAASIYDRRLNEIDNAYNAYRRALAIIVDNAVPNERELLRRLEEMLGRAAKWPELIQVYDDVISRSNDDLRREAMIKRARLLEDGLQDQPRAIEGWRDVVLAVEGMETPILIHA
jgi:tetratricopeptide (TPR) repeat protein